MAKPTGRHDTTAEVRAQRHCRQRDRGEATHPGHLGHQRPTPPQLPTNGTPEHERERCDDQRHHRIDPILQPQSGERRDGGDGHEPRGLASLQDGGLGEAPLAKGKDATQRVADMAREILVGQAGAHTKRAGETLEDALKAVLETEAGRQFGKLRDGPQRDKLAALWQEDLALQRRKEGEQDRRRQRQETVWEQFMQV